MTSLTVKAGTIGGNDLAQWLLSSDFTEQIQTGNTHALLEYMYRFVFTDREGLHRDLSKRETGPYGLRGRVFWDKGQIEWRRTENDTFSFLALVEDGSTPFPQKLILTCEEIPDANGIQEDTTMVLWGTYNDKIKVFLEKQVSGSQPIPYPSSLHTGKTYPVLRIRIYKNMDGDPVFWRFTGPDTMNPEDWKKEKK